MAYIKAALFGLIVLAVTVGAVTFILGLFYLDARAFIGMFPMISVPAMFAIFGAAFRWQIVRESRRVRRGMHARTT